MRNEKFYEKFIEYMQSIPIEFRYFSPFVQKMLFNTKTKQKRNHFTNQEINCLKICFICPNILYTHFKYKYN